MSATAFCASLILAGILPATAGAIRTTLRAVAKKARASAFCVAVCEAAYCRSSLPISAMASTTPMDFPFTRSSTFSTLSPSGPMGFRARDAPIRAKASCPAARSSARAPSTFINLLQKPKLRSMFSLIAFTLALE